jgi:CheY-like chemotaxis protein
MRSRPETEGTVLIVDEDKTPMQYYVDAFEMEGFSVERCFSPDTAEKFLQKEPADLAAIILDIMMPPGERYKHKDTKDGLITGFFLYQDFKKKYPNVPIVILTNVANPETLKLFTENLLLKVAAKLDYPPFDLVDLVNEMRVD